MSWDAFADTIAPFFGQDAETQIQQGNFRKDADGKYKPGLMDSFWGRANDGQAVLDTQTNTKNRETYKPQLEALGGRWADGMTEGSALAEIQSLRDERSQTNAIKAQNLAFMDPAQQELRRKQDQQFAASRQDVANQMALTRETMAQTSKDRLLDRADAREAKAAELEYAKIRDRKADQQYNERMEQLDRKDRRQGISSLAAGLAALGAAFAA